MTLLLLEHTQNMKGSLANVLIVLNVYFLHGNSNLSPWYSIFHGMYRN